MKLFKTLSLALLASTALLFNACKRTELVKPLDGRGQTIIKFASNTGNLNYSLLALDVQTTPQVVALADIRRDAPNEQELGKAVTISIKEDTAALNAYNINNGTSLVRLPANLFTWDAVNTPVNGQWSLTFQPGEFAKRLTVTVPNTSLFDFSKRYAVAFMLIEPITGADGKISFDQRTMIVEVSVKNKYDGIYSIRGYAFLGGNTAAPYLFNADCGFSIKAQTTGQNSIKLDAQPMFRGAPPTTTYGFSNVIPEFVFDLATDKVTNVRPAPGSIPMNFPYGLPYDSRYDAATKTIYVKFGVNNNPAWYIIDTLTYCGPR